MYKKRGDRVRIGSKGQITLFIIVGVIIFIVFLILLQLASALQRAQLLDTQREIRSGIFSKEALRIFVDQCLREGMEEGLTLLGKQGRIWNDQFGGREPFVEGVTGVNVGADRVFYGIANEVSEPAYPCNSNEDGPSFCKYNYPNTVVNFGTLKLDRRFIQADLERFLTQSTVACVEQLVRNEINDVARVETSADASFRLSLNTGVINVKVNYPIRLLAGDGEFVHISQFDFTYTSDFDQLIKTVVLFPLRNDQKYVDFNYSEETLLAPFFNYESEFFDENYCEDEICRQSTRSAQHTALGLRMERNDLNGDDVFSFTLPKGRIIPGAGGEYSYKFVRQNRAPALDYVSRSACIDYDYLVVQGDTELGSIDFKPSAIDPDEDSFEFSFGDNFPDDESTELDRYFVSATSVLGITPSDEPYIFRVASNDNNSKEDYQDVRVLVTEPLITELKLDSPFTGGEAHKNLEGVYILSREDPFFADLDFSTSGFGARSRMAELEYNSEAGKNFKFGFARDTNGNCLSLPYNNIVGEDNAIDPIPCDFDLNAYSDPVNINEFSFDNALHGRPFTSNFVEDKGELVLRTSAQFCSEQEAFSSKKVEVIVKGCIPVRNGNNLNSYPNHNDGTNPFLATHACCLGDINYYTSESPSEIEGDPNSEENKDKGEWRIAPAGTECYEEPGINCKGRVEGRTTGNNRGFVQETSAVTCDGRRGNVCDNSRTGRKGTLVGGELTCGDPSESSCSRVPTECANVDSWGYADPDETPNTGDEGWCNGRMGCESFCEDAVVLEDENIAFVSDDLTMNKFAENNLVSTNADLNVHCGCTDNDLSPPKKCDSDYDGEFDGFCRNQGGISCIGG
jgi:hypothetical protein